MNDEKWIKLSKVLLIIASLMLIINGVYHSCKRGSSTTDNNATIRTVESIKSEHESARSEVESAERSVGDAEEHVERATDAVSRSEDAAARNAESVDQLQTLIDECKGIVEAQREIIRDVDRANGTRPAENVTN